MRLRNSEVAEGPLVASLQHAFAPARLHALANASLRDRYLRASPFPHAVMDGLFPPVLLAAISSEIPDRVAASAGERSSGACKGVGGGAYGSTKTRDASPADRWSRMVRCWDGLDAAGEDAVVRKQSVEDEANMGPATRLAFAHLRGRAFASFLSRISGISGLVADPEYFGSGIHVTTRGGLLKVHADFNFHPKLHMRRRVNVFLFLNEDWPDSYGGHLELWDCSMTQCEERIAPLYGRLVMFSTTDFSFHGHPHPLVAPHGRSRRSLALYFYTSEFPPDDCENRNCSVRMRTLWKDPKIRNAMCSKSKHKGPTA